MQRTRGPARAITPARTRARGGAVVVALGLASAGLTACLPQLPPPSPPAVYNAACKGTLVASTPGTITAGAITELSGIAASRLTPGVWWVNNDSGDTARVFAIADDGRELGEFALTG